MSKEIGLGRLTILYSIGNLGSKILSFAIFFVYTFYLTKEEIGLFDIILSTIALISPVLSLQVYDSIFRWILDKKDPDHIKIIITNTIAIVVFCLLIFSIVFFCLSLVIEIKYFFPTYVLILLNTLYPVGLNTLRGLNKNMVYTFCSILYSTIFCILILLGLGPLGLRIEGILYANCFALFITLIFIFYKINLSNNFKFNLINNVVIKEMLKFSLPLIPNTLSWWAISTIDRYFIFYYLGTTYNGNFAIGSKFPTILLMLTNIFGLAWQEKAIKTYNSSERDHFYTIVFSKYFKLLFASIIVLIAFTKPMLKFLIQPSYFQVWQFIPFLYIAVGFQALASFYGTGYLSTKDTKSALTTTIYGVIVTIALNFILIPYLGLIGSSLSILFGYLVLFTIRVFNTSKYFKIDLPLRQMIYLLTLTVIIGLGTISENMFLLSLNCLIAIGIFIYFNINLISEVVDKFPNTKFYKFYNTISGSSK